MLPFDEMRVFLGSKASSLQTDLSDNAIVQSAGQTDQISPHNFMGCPMLKWCQSVLALDTLEMFCSGVVGDGGQVAEEIQLQEKSLFNFQQIQRKQTQTVPAELFPSCN